MMASPHLYMSYFYFIWPLFVNPADWRHTPVLLVGYEEAVHGHGEGEDAETDHEGGVDVEPHGPEVQLYQQRHRQLRKREGGCEIGLAKFRGQQISLKFFRRETS